MLDLKNVTLLTIHDKDADTSLDLLNFCQKQINFGEVKLFSSSPPEKDLGNVKFIKIPSFGHYDPHDQSENNNGYSEFCVNLLHEYINTDFALIIQTDGFITHPELWLNDFLNYDYIGAAWPDFILHGSNWLEPNIKSAIPNYVGNGGFSLRSKKILKLASQCQKKLIGPEDVYFCLNNYDFFTRHGIKYAPKSLADKFSKDDWGNVHHDCFGFHGNKTHYKTCLNLT